MGGRRGCVVGVAVAARASTVGAEAVFVVDVSAARPLCTSPLLPLLLWSLLSVWLRSSSAKSPLKLAHDAVLARLSRLRSHAS